MEEEHMSSRTFRSITVAGAIAMEERDLSAVAGLAATSDDEAESAPTDVALTRAA